MEDTELQFEDIGTDLDAANASKDIYKDLNEKIRAKCKDTMTWKKFLAFVQMFFNTNMQVLTTNIVGRGLLLNKKLEENILSTFGLTHDEVKKSINESTYFKETFGRQLMITDQLCFGIPLILAAIEYKKQGKDEYSSTCYLFAHFKPYASRESFFFKPGIGVNEGQMRYTLERTLTDRFDIKKQGTVLLALQKRSATSYEHYIDGTYKKGSTTIPTDKFLYVVYTSGIASSVNSFLGGIFREYNKNAGKSLAYEDAIAGSYDKDSDSTKYEDNDIESNAAVKTNMLNSVLAKITKNPVDSKLLKLAAQYGFHSSSQMYVSVMDSALNEIIDKDFELLRPFFDGLIASFLFHENDEGQVYTMRDVKSPVFLAVGIDILAGKKPHLNDINQKKCRDILQKMLEDHSVEYMQHQESYRRQFKSALAAYFVYLLKASA